MSISALELCYPSSISSYNHAQLLHKAYNSENQKSDWIEIQFNENFNVRTNNVSFHDTSKNKQSKNILCNKFTILNNKIPYTLGNMPSKMFKEKLRLLFL